MTITKEQFAGLGRQIYGTVEMGPGSWQKQYAELLGITTRQLHRITKGDKPIPAIRVRQFIRIRSMVEKMSTGTG